MTAEALTNHSLDVHARIARFLRSADWQSAVSQAGNLRRRASKDQEHDHDQEHEVLQTIHQSLITIHYGRASALLPFYRARWFA